LVGEREGLGGAKTRFATRTVELRHRIGCWRWFAVAPILADRA